MTESIKNTRPGKRPTRPNKPYPDFPLGPHPGGMWQKKIRGKIHYFGRWGRTVDGTLTRVPGDGWEEALAAYKAVAADLHAGRTPRIRAEALTVADLANRFLTAKTRAMDAGEITARTFADYKLVTDRLIERFGKDRFVTDLASEDFESLRAELAKDYGPVRLSNEIQRTRTVFKYGYEAGLITQPVRYGATFKKPSAAVLRKHKAAAGKKLIAAADARRLVDAAGLPLRAMILLGLNAGLGNSDVATLPLAALDLVGGWLNYPRPKTGVDRKAKLWPETVEALRSAIAARPEPKEKNAQGLVFVTRFGKTWAGGKGRTDAVNQETGKVFKKCGIVGRGLGFYSLRHTFRTVADATRDFPAVRLVMGHADGSIDAVYREQIEDGRLEAVAEHVRGWLFLKS